MRDAHTAFSRILFFTKPRKGKLMTKNFLITLAAVSAMAFGSAAYAQQTTSYDTSGGGEIEWEFEFDETEVETVNAGTDYSFGGGAGTSGDVSFEAGDYALVGAIAAQEAGGSGNAYSNTNGGGFAESEFESASYAANGGLGYDETFGNNPAEVSFEGVVTAGGAGSAITGVVNGSEYSYDQTAEGSFSYEYNNETTTN
ncbi:MAG: hypothetical protein ACI9H6_000096 [Patiriisocius sp.]|jgi:hypothetical protein